MSSGSVGATLSTILVCVCSSAGDARLEPRAIVHVLAVALVALLGGVRQLLDAPLQLGDVGLGLGRLGADVGRVAGQQRRRLVEHLAQPRDLLLVVGVALVDVVEPLAQVGDLGVHLLALAAGDARQLRRETQPQTGQQQPAGQPPEGPGTL